MADTQQLAILQKKGVEAWNTWRRVHTQTQANLSGASLRGANLNGADLSGADLRRADLSGATLIGADLSGADLKGALLLSTYLSGAKLKGAELSGANLKGADLIGANLSGADLIGATLFSTYLIGTTLFSADLSFARVAGTIFGNVDLHTVKGLDTVSHLGPSTIGTNTLVLSEGDIPEVFLRGAGLSDTFITYIRSLVGKPIEYYSCFISYSSKDQEFVERLYADLQSKGVRCWFAPEDLKTGDKIRDRIDQSIRVHDKLLLVLSQHSVNSSWVEFEVEAAIAKENNRNALMLFPIRLDSAVKDSLTSWAAHIRRTRNITDFTNWKQHDAYQKVLNRLLRDLKPETPPVAKQE